MGPKDSIFEVMVSIPPTIPLTSGLNTFPSTFQITSIIMIASGNPKIIQFANGIPVYAAAIKLGAVPISVPNPPASEPNDPPSTMTFAKLLLPL